jgi:3-oxoadipate enol-lactonase
MKIKANGISINCLVEGRDGAPWLIFSNSIANTLAMWDEQVAALSRDYRILRYDARGHGGTDAPEGAYSFDMLVGDVIGLMNHFSISRANFIGLSLGGMTGLGLAIDHPQRIERLVACACRADAPPPYQDAWRQRIAQIQEKGLESLVEPTIQRWFTPGFIASNPAAVEKVRGMMRSTPAHGYIGCGHALIGLNYLSRVPAIKTPTLFVAGKQDQGAPPDVMKAMHTALPGSRFAELDPAGHILNIENPKGWADAVVPFLKS